MRLIYRPFIVPLAMAMAMAMAGACSSPDNATINTASTTPPIPSTTSGQATDSTRIFRAYLQQKFGQSISAQGEQWYVIIPAVGCIGCSRAALRWLARTKWAPNVTVVASGLLRDLTAAERKQLSHHAKLLADTVRIADNSLDRLNLPFSTLTGVMHTNNGRAIALIPFDGESYQQVLAQLPKRNN